VKEGGGKRDRMEIGTGKIMTKEWFNLAMI
jgi:hypothetical protein